MRGSNNLIWRNDMQDYFSDQSLGGRSGTAGDSFSEATPYVGVVIRGLAGMK